MVGTQLLPRTAGSNAENPLSSSTDIFGSKQILLSVLLAIHIDVVLTYPLGIENVAQTCCFVHASGGAGLSRVRF
jgi:hypothetical protein